MIKEITDEELVEEYLKTQNGCYFDVLYERYSKKVFAKCLSLLKDYNLAEDAMQDIFLKLMTNLSKFKNKSKFSTWLYSITYNFCIDSIRKGKRNVEDYNEDLSNYNESENDQISDKILLETEIYNLKIILEKLPLQDKMILLMKYQDDMSIKEICDVYNKTESAIKMQIKRAKEKFVKYHNETFER
ncbi:MAG TPA: RNA polymerase sigma factor [Saprospiraceae bacterium]|nr:RNA polymerase sigma factor [Saprospiraceae bacterium]